MSLFLPHRSGVPRRWLSSCQLARGATALLLGCITSVALCASLNVDPIVFELTGRQAASVLKITNAGTEVVRLQVSGLDWTSENGRPVLTDNDSLVINPPIFSIAPGAVQFVRFGARSAAGASIERAFRLLIDEVPAGAVGAGGLRTLLRVSIPVFIAPLAPQRDLLWQVDKTASGYVLAASNRGNFHSKILQLAIAAPDQGPGVKLPAPIYLLAGQRSVWPVPLAQLQAGPAGLNVSLQADKVDSEEHFTLPVP